MKQVVLWLGMAVALMPFLPANAAEHWSANNLVLLRQWVAAAPREALASPSVETLDQAEAKADPLAVDEAANELALDLARRLLLGTATASERAGWHIHDADASIDLPAMLDRALDAGILNTFFADLRPRHPDYAILRNAYALESDPEKRVAIARNMERWRWMPRSLGRSFLIVNAATFEVNLWRDGRHAGRWPVIVGKPSTPTPVFEATVTGVTLNPWWNVPASIVRESIGALVARNPALARSRGYVWSGGVYRQRPGPGNALGQMKLVMPNGFNVYLHDTPSKALFEEEVRAFSHGCVRVGDALGFAVTLLEGKMSRQDVDEVVAARKTTTVDIDGTLPIYVTYFTAVGDADGSVRTVPDLYGRDARIHAFAVVADSTNDDERVAMAGGCK